MQWPSTGSAARSCSIWPTVTASCLQGVTALKERGTKAKTHESSSLTRVNGTILLGKTEFISYICSMKKYRTVIAYKDYFENFLMAQKPKVQSKILQILRLIEEMEVVPRNYLKHITGTNGLFELRVIFGGDIFRVFCFFDAGKLVVLLSGFQKKTQNTPKNEIDKAVRLMSDYYREKAAEE